MYFELTDNKIVKNNMTLTQIKAIKDFPQFDIVVGTLGGWISEKAQIANNGKVWIGENATIFGGTFEGGTFWGGTFRGGTFEGGSFRGGTFEGGTFEGGTFRGGTFEGGNFYGGIFWGGTFRGGTFKGGYFRGGTFEGGTFRGGTFEGGTFWGGLIPFGFGLVPFINCAPYPINFAGWVDSVPYFSCGCQHHSLDKWNDETFRKNLANKHKISKKDLKSLESGLTYIQTLI